MRQLIQDQELDPKRVLKLVGMVVSALFLLFVILGSFYTVHASERAVITRFGAFKTVTDPGLHLKFAFIDSVVRVNVRSEAIEWGPIWDEGKLTGDSSLAAYSHDQQPANISVKVTYRVKTDLQSVENLYTVYRDTATYANRIITPRVTQAVKTVFGQYTAVSVIQNRQKFNIDVDQAVRSMIENGSETKTMSPIIIEGIQVQNIDFSDAYEHAVEARMQAQVEVEKVTQNVEKEKKMAEIKVVQAQAEADSTVARAKAQAEATRIQGEAEAKAIRARSEALRSNPELVKLTMAERWNGVLPTTMVPDKSVPFMNLK